MNFCGYCKTFRTAKTAWNLCWCSSCPGSVEMPTMCKARCGASGRRRFQVTISTVCCWRSIRSMKLSPRWSGRSSCGRSSSESSFFRKSSRMATGSGRLSLTFPFQWMGRKWKNCPWKMKQWLRRWCLLSNTHRPKKESYIMLDMEMEDYYRIKNEGKNSNTGK